MRIGKWLAMYATIIFGLAGCATKSVQTDYDLSSSQSEGIVILSISHDLDAPNRTKAIYYMDGGLLSGGRTIFSVDDNMIGQPDGGEFKDSRGHLLVVALAPGRHVIDSWQITNGSGLRILPKEKPKPLEFEVTKGGVKYLGNIHANLKLGKGIFGATTIADGYPEVIDRRKRDITLFENKYPQFKNKVAIGLLPVGPWARSLGTTKRSDPVYLPPVK